MKITRKQLNKLISEAISEVYIGDDEVNYVKLVNFCLNNDFLFCLDKFKIRCANCTEIQKAIAAEVLQGRLEISHDIDDIIENLRERNQISENVEVIKVTLPNENYYIIWEH